VAQGFYFSQPLTAGDFDALLAAHFRCSADLAGLRGVGS
jgi:EAL domain-containing protein (putative c-di-GMP-specific phosphodiesterase class I)